MFILLRLLFIFLFLFLCVISLSYSYPTIIIHGIASNKEDLQEFSIELSKETENTIDNKVYNMEIESGKWSSIFMNLNQQCEIFANNINDLNITEEKINLIGFSQGGLIARCYVEKYSDKIIGVNSLITIAAPNMGIFTPIINPINTINPKKEYWKNPFKYNKYVETNDFLVYINNEKPHLNYLDYKNNILLLNNFLIVWSSIDNIITPLESSKFGFYDIDVAEKYNKLEIQPLRNSSIYNTLGLRELDATNKLIFYQCDCMHEEFKLPSCFKDKLLIKKIVPYL